MPVKSPLGQLKADLVRLTGLDPLPPRFWNSIAMAIETYCHAPESTYQRAIELRAERASEVIEAARAFLTLIDRFYEVMKEPGKPPAAGLVRQIASVKPVVDDFVRTVRRQEAILLFSATKRRRGQALTHQDRAVLRDRVFWALHHAGKTIGGSPNGRVAKVLSAVLSTADALKAGRERHELAAFKQHDWKKWLREFKHARTEAAELEQNPERMRRAFEQLMAKLETI